MAVEGFDEWAWLIGAPTALVVGLYIWKRQPPCWDPIEARFREWPDRTQDWYQEAKRNSAPRAFTFRRIALWLGLAGSFVLGFVNFLNEIDMTVDERRQLTLLSLPPMALIYLSLVGHDRLPLLAAASGWLVVSWIGASGCDRGHVNHRVVRHSPCDVQL